jgi:hypothetical protein
MKKRVLFTSAVVALTMGLSLDAQAQRVKGINAQLPFGGSIAIDKQTAKNLVPGRQELKGLRGVVNAAQPGPLQALANGFAAKGAIKHLGSIQGPEVYFDSGSYEAKPSTLVGFIRSFTQPAGAVGTSFVNAVGNSLAAGLNAGGYIGAGFLGGTLPALLGAPQVQ